MRKICVILARSGSKGLKNKNMLFIDGKPMLFHSIDAALASNLFDKEDIFVSTDDKNYAEIIATTGVNIVLRDKSLATDTATTFDALNDFLSDFEEDLSFILLQPTSPLRTGENISDAFEIFDANSTNANVVGISQADKDLSLYTTVSSNNKLSGLAGVDKNYTRQKKEKTYYPNGAIFISTKQRYLKEKSFFTEDTLGYKMSGKSTIDVDGKDDFYQAVGGIFFDYKRREIQNEFFYKEKYRNYLKENSHYDKWIVGDSRMLGITLEKSANLSIGGVTLKRALESLEQTILSKRAPKEILLALGVNDFITGYDVLEIKENFLHFIKLAKKNDVKLTVMSIFDTLFIATVNNDDLIVINKFVKEHTERNGFKWVDPNIQLSKNGRLQYKYTVDGLHLNEEGNKILADFLRKNVMWEG